MSSQLKRGRLLEPATWTAEQLDRAVKTSVIVRFRDALFMVVEEPNHACLFDGRPDPSNRLQQLHRSPFCGIQRSTGGSRLSRVDLAQNSPHGGSPHVQPS